MNELKIHGGNAKNGRYIYSFEYSKSTSSQNDQVVEKGSNILLILFRHGAPANLAKQPSAEKSEFANYYLKGFSGEL